MYTRKLFSPYSYCYPYTHYHIATTIGQFLHIREAVSSSSL